MKHLTIKPVREDDRVYVFEVKARNPDAGDMKYGVSLRKDDFRRWGREGETPPEFVERCFEFLLEREPMTAILSRFDVSVIPQYFPEFEEEIAAE
jgi:hypothetical protein